MTTKRFSGPSIREIMLEVRKELGEDAMIISNRRVNGGVEVVAMSDETHRIVTEEAQSSKPKVVEIPSPASKASHQASTTPKRPLQEAVLSFQEQLLLRDKLRLQDQDAGEVPLPNPFGKSELAPVAVPQPAITQHRRSVGKAAYATHSTSEFVAGDLGSAEVTVKLSSSPSRQAPESIPERQPTKEPDLEVFEAELVDESVEEEPQGPVLPSAAERFADDLRKARAITEWSSQMVGDLNSMQDLIRRQILPKVSQSTLFAEINQLLAKAGFQKDLCTQMLSRLPGELAERRMDRNEISRWLEHALVEQVSVMSSHDVWWGGRAVIALVGSNGVGKSTAIAKLAARFVMENSALDIVLLSIDSENNESIRNHADVLGIDCQIVADYEDLDAVIRSYSYKQMVLIDTPGLSYRNKRLAPTMQRLSMAQTPMKVMLVLNASSEAESLEAMASTYKAVASEAGLSLDDCIITKLDEAVRIGALISIMARNGLRVNYQSAGSGALEDFERGSALALVRQSLERYSLDTEITAVDGTRDSGEQFDIMRNKLLDNVAEMSSILTSIRKEFKNAGFAEGTRSIGAVSTPRKNLPYGQLIEEKKGVDVASSSGKPELLWAKNDYPVESAYFSLGHDTLYVNKGNQVPALPPKIRSIN
jgi:flagellar biosynthesis GTPase FlhF